MKDLKYIPVFALIFIFSINEVLWAQNDEYDPANFISAQETTSNTQTEKSEENNKLSKWSYNLNMGTSFSTSSFGSFLDVYTAPQINYNLSPKWQISAGVLIMNSTLVNGTADGQSVNQTRAYIMNRISYQANEKLRISGEILYGMNKSPFQTDIKQKNEYSINFDAEYKINDSFSIGLKVSSSNMNPYGYNPYYPGIAPISPLYRSPFEY